MSVWTIVLAAGSGDRFGGQKQFERLGDRRLVDWPIHTAAEVSAGVVVVVPPGHGWSGPTVSASVDGGATHGDSVRAGLTRVDPAAEIVLVATAVHPLASVSLYRAVIEAVRRGADAAAPVVASADAIKRVHDNRIAESLDKTELRIVQAPSAFRASMLRQALDELPDAPEELELIERAGGLVATVPGEPGNIHVATVDDLRLAERLLPT
ncbi:MAG: IspD/TarI family cytidylyltransferase [Acidimicrobiales bacterium]